MLPLLRYETSCKGQVKLRQRPKASSYGGAGSRLRLTEGECGRCYTAYSVKASLNEVALEDAA